MNAAQSRLYTALPGMVFLNEADDNFVILNKNCLKGRPRKCKICTYSDCQIEEGFSDGKRLFAAE